ncbi:MAG: FCD domain-containing protein, partial [Sphaerochaeta sp.]|nr:FCD domain-containing protein [Sphaerochaeta sp.]
LASTLIPIIHSAVKIFAYLYGKPLTETTIATHREILDAIRDKNPERAEIAMRKHLQRNRVYAEHLRETAGDNA